MGGNTHWGVDLKPFDQGLPTPQPKTQDAQQACFAARNIMCLSEWPHALLKSLGN